MDLNQLKEKLTKLEKELDQISNISIQQQSASCIEKISVVIGSSGKKKIGCTSYNQIIFIA
jgi:hypothetical protein